MLLFTFRTPVRVISVEQIVRLKSIVVDGLNITKLIYYRIDYAGLSEPGLRFLAEYWRSTSSIKTKNEISDIIEIVISKSSILQSKLIILNKRTLKCII